MRKGVKRVLGLGVLAGAGYAVWRTLEKSRTDTGLTWQARPFPYPPEPVATPHVPETAPEGTREDAERADTDWTAWVEGVDGSCPSSHPIKAKLASGIFHEPGGTSYARTRADRCYVTAVAAEADGLRPAKR